MKDLIERLKVAKGPDRDLDSEILFLITSGVGCGHSRSGPAFTASIDAAMTLVPEGTGFGLLLSRDRKDCRADIWGDERTEERFFIGATPALALCIAALQARSTEIDN
jgi:hypothetical protein